VRSTRPRARSASSTASPSRTATQEPVRRAEDSRASTCRNATGRSCASRSAARPSRARPRTRRRYLQDGISFNNADGSGDYYQIDRSRCARSRSTGRQRLAYRIVPSRGRSTHHADRAHAIALSCCASTAKLGNLQWQHPGVARVGDYTRGECDYSHQNGYRDHSLSDYQHYTGTSAIASCECGGRVFYHRHLKHDQKLRAR